MSGSEERKRKSLRELFYKIKNKSKSPQPRAPPETGATARAPTPPQRRVAFESTPERVGPMSRRQDDDDEDNLFYLRPHSAFTDYIRSRSGTAAAAGQPISGYEQYDPFGETAGAHQQFGTRREGGSLEYPWPGSQELGQSMTGYTERHPSEQQFPRTRQEVRRTAVYGTYQGQPVQGASHWPDYYPNWSDVGQRMLEPIPMTEPLLKDEIEFVKKYGFFFGRFLGKGAYGSVFAVTATRLLRGPDGQYVDAQLACKVLSLQKFRKPLQITVEEAVDKMMQESDLHSQLSHRNIVKCEHIFYLHDQQTGFPFLRLLIMMEYCEGDLKLILSQSEGNRLEEEKAKEFLRQVSDALQYLHNQNVCHFDLKPPNIMYVTEGGHTVYKLADFGISKKYVSEQASRIYGRAGTASYMAPELAQRPPRMSLSKPADIYSLGIVMCEVLCGRGKQTAIQTDFKTYKEDEPLFWPQFAQKWRISEEATHLIFDMTCQDPTKRPTIAQVCQSPFLNS